MRRLAVIAAICLGGAGCPGSGRALAQHDRVANLDQMFARLMSCWQRPSLPLGNPGMQITVMVTFTRDGAILGHPRITYETRSANDDERIIYRTAVMQALQRCVPMPFVNGMGNAIAGRPLTIRFDDRRIQHKPSEKRA
ncbi:MAG TPA: hypothetical protein VHC94_06635 [Nitrobacter sp.]|jgi:hypothetical protein|nr:hypothetical protein [Nitrobacter sp.]